MFKSSLPLAAFAVAAAFAGFGAVQPGHADANAPVCAVYYGPNEGLSCNFSNFAQCRATVQGLAGSCVDNPRHVSRTRESKPDQARS